MDWAFVDYENTGSLAGMQLERYEKVFVFCGPNNKSIKIADSPGSGFQEISYITLKSTGRNNVDFHMAYHIGRHDEAAPEEAEFHVVSNDTGFDGLIKHIKKCGRKCRRIRTRKAPVKAAKKAPAKKTAKKAAKKTAAKKTPAKKAAKKAPKKTAPTKKTKGLSDDACKVITVLHQVDPALRPQSRAKLLNWMKPILADKSSATYREMLILELQGAGLILEHERSLSYPIG